MALAHLPSASFLLVDDDVVEEHNLPTAYQKQQVASTRTAACQSSCGARPGQCCDLHARPGTPGHWRRVPGLDCFDNVPSRSLACGLTIYLTRRRVARADRDGSVGWAYHCPRVRRAARNSFARTRPGRVSFA
jgi:hypothetical protein